MLLYAHLRKLTPYFSLSLQLFIAVLPRLVLRHWHRSEGEISLAYLSHALLWR